MTWIWEQPEWPAFRWSTDDLSPALGEVRHAQGQLLGRFEALGFSFREHASLDTFTRDVTLTSAIEGEILDPIQVRSSVARRLGVDIGGLAPADRHIDGIVDMTLDATRNFATPLSKGRLFGWHAALFPGRRSGIQPIRVGEWRDDASGPMQVISGPMGRERVHYRAPPASRIDAEMTAFLEWFDNPAGIAMDPVIKAGVAHLWFVTIHPFDDGNGRIARAIADLALARSESSPQRFYSMSAQIRTERSAYYDALERTQFVGTPANSNQAGGVEITAWLTWFLGCMHRAIADARISLAHVLRRADFWAGHSHLPLNPRQIKLLNLLLDGLDTALTSSKWAKLGNCSQDTAGRDIAGLIELGILRKGPGGGRSSTYELVVTSTS